MTGVWISKFNNHITSEWVSDFAKDMTGVWHTSCDRHRKMDIEVNLYPFRFKMRKHFEAQENLCE